MSKLIQPARSILAVLLGYAAMVILITFIQEGLFGGVSYYESSRTVLVVAGALTVLCAVIGGFAAAWIAGRAYLIHALIMSAFVAIETTTLYVTGRVGGPLWFDILAAASLIVGLLIGAESFRRVSYTLKSDENA